MTMLFGAGRAARALLASIVAMALLSAPIGAEAATTVTVYGGGYGTNVTMPDALAAALVASGQATVDNPADAANLNTIASGFSTANIAFLLCLVGRGSCGAQPGTAGALDFSSAANSAFIL